MQDVLELPREFFRPSSFGGGSQNSLYRNSSNNAHFGAFRDGLSDVHRGVFIRANEQTGFEHLRRYSPRSAEWSDGIVTRSDTTLSNSYELRNPPPEYRLRRISPSDIDVNRNQENLRDETERYAAFGARPLVGNQEFADGNNFPRPPEYQSPEKKLSTNRKKGYRDSRGLLLFIWVLIFVFIALGAISIGLGLHYGLSESPTTSSTLKFKFTVVNATFDESLANFSSSNYFNWSSRVCDACSRILAKHGDLTFVQACDDVTFSSGSIRVSLSLQLSSDLNQNKASSILNETFPNNFLSGYECRIGFTDEEGDHPQGSTSHATTVSPKTSARSLSASQSTSTSKQTLPTANTDGASSATPSPNQSSLQTASHAQNDSSKTPATSRPSTQMTSFSGPFSDNATTTNNTAIKNNTTNSTKES